MPLDQHGNLSPGPEPSPTPSAPTPFPAPDPAPATAPATGSALPQDPDSTDPRPSFSCSKCGADIPPSPALDVMVDELPDSIRPEDVVVLCAACSDPASTPDATQPPSPHRIFKVEVRISELVGVDPSHPGVPDTWEDVAGFTLRGPGRTVREFTDTHAEEWATRMEQVLKFADL